LRPAGVLQRLRWILDRAFSTDPTIEACSIAARRRKVPEQPDFRAWKAKLHEAYRAVEPEKDTWIYPTAARERRHHAESRSGVPICSTTSPKAGPGTAFDGLIRVQRETLDNLAEAVAVFGSNAARNYSIRRSRRCGSCRPRRCASSRISRPWKPVQALAR